MASTRREFLKRSALGVSVSFVAPGLLVRSAFADTLPQRILVVLQLDGGNDGVNTFIPYTDSRYRSMRPTLAIPDAEILKLDDRMGLHPAMSKMKTLYESRKLAVINNVGFGSLDRSHFRCRDVWQTADDSYGQVQRGITGWLGRYADVYLDQETSSLATVSIGNGNALGVVAEEKLPIAVANAQSFDVLTDSRYPNDRTPFVTSLRTIYNHPLAGDGESIRAQGQETFSAIDLLKTIPPASTTAGYPNTNLGRAFQLAAQIVAGNVGTHAIWIRSGGYDTHNAQAQDHAQLLTDVSDSLAAFDTDLAARNVADRVMVLAWSEFGRRVQENASAGTDHGKAGTMFVVGNAVKGGMFYGDVPDLSNLDNGDLRTEIDFRAVYSTVIRDWFGHDPAPVISGTYENLGFVGTVPSYGHRVRGRR
jgi:uncharacterized protein (DUF1501 family)